MMERRYTSILIIFFIFSLFSINISNSNLILYPGGISNSSEIYDLNFNNQAILDHIYITGSNWSQAISLGWCTGEGTINVPYVIENFIIDASNSPTGSGILIENSAAYFSIQNCTVYNANSTWGDAGIKISQASNGVINNNNCSFNKRFGIFVTNCDEMIVIENEAYNNSQYGIAIGGTPSALLEGNIANFNGGIQNPDIGGTGVGIGLISSNFDILIGNTANYNIGFGIHAGYSNFTNILNCEANGNTRHGITTDHSHDNTIVGNTANNNEEVGIIASGYDFNITNNEILNTEGIGLLVESINESTIIGNTIRNSDENGILLKNSSSNEINDNTITDNFRNGIGLQDCNNNTISGNSIISNNDHGLRLITSDNNTISSNIINKNGQYGILLSESNNNEITENKLIGNQDCFNEIDCQNNVFTNNQCGRIYLRYSLIGCAGLLVLVSIPIILVSLKKRK
ncbi:MAG: hypothetical protein FK730_04550 [Asgard group archaeon]|nr:hypothetical protein [Asgard group archaeon]